MAVESWKSQSDAHFITDTLSWGRPLFSQTADYALRAVAQLASQPGLTNTIRIIAEETGVNAPYLRKVLNRLRDAGIVETQRGSGGGVTLVVQPDLLTILDVLNAVDPITRIKQCPLGQAEHLELCPLHSELDKAIGQIEIALSQKTIGELLQSKCSQNSQCNFPRSADCYKL